MSDNLKKYMVTESDSYSSRVKYYQTTNKINVYKKFVDMNVLDEFIRLLIKYNINLVHNRMKELNNIKKLPYEKEFIIKIMENQKDNFSSQDDLSSSSEDHFLEDLEDFDNKKYSFISKVGYNYINLNATQILDIYDNKCQEEIFSLLDKQSIKNLFYWYHTSGQGHQFGDPGKEWTNIKIEKYKEPEYVLI